MGDDGDDEDRGGSQGRGDQTQVAVFKARPLAEEYPFLWIDALYQKVRVEGRVVSVAVMIACAVRKEWLGASWQRRKVHFMLNILAKVPHREKGRFAAHLKQIWLEPDQKSAKRAAATAILDRLFHKAHIFSIDGHSYRLNDFNKAMKGGPLE